MRLSPSFQTFSLSLFLRKRKNIRTFVHHQRFRKTPEIAFVVYTISIYAVKIHQ